MHINTELPLYAIAIIASFLQVSSIQIFMSLDHYRKSVLHSHGETSDIELAIIISLGLWISCIMCVAVALASYLFFVEWVIVFLLLNLCIISLGTVILIYFAVTSQMPFLIHIIDSAV